MMAMSLTQGGSGFQYIAEPMYDYLCGKEITSINITVEDVTNGEVRNLIEKLHGYVQFSYICTALIKSGKPSVLQCMLVCVCGLAHINIVCG